MTRSDVAALDELRLLVVVDNETDTLSSIADGVPQTPEVVQAFAPARYGPSAVGSLYTLRAP